MLRSLLVVLALGLTLAVPSQAAPLLVKAQSCRVKSVERVSLQTGSGWRMELVSDRGEGAIIRIDLASGGERYVGEISFAGWSQKELQSLYRSALLTLEADGAQAVQLG
jgi:hypothetical protein